MPSMAKVGEVAESALNEHALLEEMITFKREALTKLQGLLLAEQSNLHQAKREIETTRQEITRMKQDKWVEFEKEMDAVRQGMREEQKGLERLALELNGRTKEVQQLEAQAEPVTLALEVLKEERIAIEQQRVRNEELRQENDRISNSIATLQEEAAQLKAMNVAEQQRLHLQAQDQEARERQLEAKAKEVGLQTENLTALKETLDPKLAELKRSEEQAAGDRQQAETLRAETLANQAELEKQKAALAILSSQLQAKGDALTEYDAALKRTEAELRIKVQEAKVTGVEMPPVPSTASTTATE